MGLALPEGKRQRENPLPRWGAAEAGPRLAPILRPHAAGGRAAANRAPVLRSVLPPPAPALSQPWHPLDPLSGWFRKLEHVTSLALSRWVYPRVLGASRLWDAQLQRRLTLSEAEVEIPDLALPLDGVTALLVTDVHTGPFLSPRALRTALDRLQELEPDLILLGGDLSTSRLEDLRGSLPAFRSLRAPLGVFAVLGNHDHDTGEPERLSGLLEACGVRVLHNTATALEREGKRLILAGVDDLHAGNPDLDGALDAARALGEEPVVLLSHNPDVFPAASRRGVSLVLSGHTHGGQVRIPGLPVLVRMSRHRLDEGRYRANGSELVVSRGLGVSGIPLRVACPPEAVLLTLRSTGTPRGGPQPLSRPTAPPTPDRAG